MNSRFWQVPVLLLTLVSIVIPAAAVEDYDRINSEMKGLMEEYQQIRNTSFLESIQYLEDARNRDDIDLLNQARLLYQQIKMVLECQGNDAVLALIDSGIEQKQFVESPDPMVQAYVDWIRVWSTYLRELKTDYQLTTDTYLRILPLFKAHGMPEEVIALYAELSYDRAMVNEFDRVHELYDEAKTYIANFENEGLDALVEIEVGLSRQNLNDDALMELAASVIHASEYFRGIGDSYRLLTANMGILAYLPVISKDEQQRVLEENLELAKRLNANNTQASLFQIAAYLYAKEDDYERAIEFSNQGLIAGKKQGSMEHVLWMRSDIAHFMVSSENPEYQDQAYEILTDVLSEFKALEEEFQVARIRMDLAKLALTSEKYESAKANIDLSLKFVRELGVPGFLKNGLLTKAKIEQALGNSREAFALLLEAYEISEELRDNELIEQEGRISFQLRNTIRENETKLHQIENELKELELKKKDLEIVSQQRAVSVANMRIQVMTLVLLVLAVILGAVYLFYRRKLSSERKLLNLNEQLELEQEQLLLEKEINEEMNLDLRASIHRMKELDEQRKEILGIAAHDMKNPVASVQSLVILAREELSKGQYGDFERYLSLCEENTSYLDQLIQKVLDARKVELMSNQLDLRWVNPKTASEQTVFMNESRAKLKKMDVEMIHSGDFELFVDSQGLREVLDNLLSNAIKFSYPAAKITLKTFPCGEMGCIEIRDGGPGFMESDFEHMFQPFAKLSARPTRDETSSGLGLSSVKLMVEGMNGTVIGENHPEGGAVFKLSFPARHQSS